MTSSGALLLADARLPTGGHTQSGGLEPALLGGMPASAVPQFLITRLRTSVLVDAATAVVTVRLLGAGRAQVTEVIAEWAARTPSDVVRTASVEAGRGYLRLHRRLFGDHPATRHRDMPRPVAVALVGHALGLDVHDVARVICHDEVQSVCSAALKLTPCDPADVVQWALAAQPEVDRAVAVAVAVEEPGDIPANAAPALELWQHAHGTASRRLFRA